MHTVLSCPSWHISVGGWACRLAVFSGCPESFEVWSQVGWWKWIVFAYTGFNFPNPTMPRKVFSANQMAKTWVKSLKDTFWDSEGMWRVLSDRPGQYLQFREKQTQGVCATLRNHRLMWIVGVVLLTPQGNISQSRIRSPSQRRSSRTSRMRARTREVCAAQWSRVRKCVLQLLIDLQDAFPGFIKFCRFCGLLLECATQSRELGNLQLFYLSFLYDSCMILQKTCTTQ